MTKEQKADALLGAARTWQNGGYVVDALDFLKPIFMDIEIEGMLCGYLDIWASVALSEVAALGFDIVDADDGE